MDKKNYTILSIIAFSILVLGAVAGATISGMTTAEETVAVSTDFAIQAWGYSSWGDCSYQTATRMELGQFCRYLGYEGLADKDPCFHEIKPVKWRWEGDYEGYSAAHGGPAMKKAGIQGHGLALTKVKCTASTDVAKHILTKQGVLDMLNSCEIRDNNQVAAASCNELCGEKTCIFGEEAVLANSKATLHSQMVMACDKPVDHLTTYFRCVCC